MVSQTHTLNSHDAPPLDAMARSTSTFAEEVFSLAELQARLAVLESRDCARRAAVPTVLVVAGVISLAGVVPIVGLTIAAVLIDFAGMSFSAALACSLGVTLIVSGALIGLGLSGLWNLPPAFPLTTREWNANMRWLRNTFRRQGRRW